jgi:hypothetical protein
VRLLGAKELLGRVVGKCVAKARGMGGLAARMDCCASMDGLLASMGGGRRFFVTTWMSPIVF